MGRLTRALLAATVGASALVGVTPAPSSGLLVWTLVGTPLTATSGQATTFTFTATNLDVLFELGCLELTFPESFHVLELGDPVGPPGRDWAARFSAANTVEVRSLSGGGRLELAQSVTFVVVAKPTAAGAMVLANHAHQRQDCGGANEIGVPVAVTVLPPILPTPKPTPPPTPKPTPTPTPILPLPSLPLPSLPLPSLPLSTPRPPEPTPRPTPSPSDRPTETPDPSSGSDPGGSGSPRPTPGGAVTGPGDGGPATPGGGGGGGDGAPTQGAASGGSLGPLTPAAALPPSAPRVQFDEGELGVGSIGIDLLGDIAVWSVPAATLGVPGVILIVWVALQAVGALAWIPAVRSLRGEG